MSLQKLARNSREHLSLKSRVARHLLELEAVGKDDVQRRLRESEKGRGKQKMSFNAKITSDGKDLADYLEALIKILRRWPKERWSLNCTVQVRHGDC